MTIPYFISVALAIICAGLFIFALGAISYGLPLWWLLWASLGVGVVDAFVLYGFKGREE